MYSIFKMQFSSAMKNLNVLLFFDHVIPTLGICPEGERRGRRKRTHTGRQEKEKWREGSLCTQVFVCVSAGMV